MVDTSAGEWTPPWTVPTLTRIAWAIILALAAADIALTVVGRQACLTEHNPFAQWVVITFGPLGLVGLKTVALALLAVMTGFLPQRYERAALSGFGLTQFAAVGWNAMLVSSLPTICG
jgi:hypothetical protein